MEMLLYYSILEKSEERWSESEDYGKEEVLSEVVDLSWLMDHYLHSFRVFLHDLLDELLCDPALIDQSLNQIVSSHSTAIISSSSTDWYLKSNSAWMFSMVEETEMMNSIFLSGEWLGEAHSLKIHGDDGDHAFLELKLEGSLGLHIDFY